MHDLGDLGLRGMKIGVEFQLLVATQPLGLFFHFNFFF